MHRPTIAVIAPVLNEAAAIGDMLASVTAQCEPAERIIVVDGGSMDMTVEIAKRAGAEVLSAAQAGRGNQIAEGLARVSEDVVLIAHADMRFRRESLYNVRNALAANPQLAGGCLGHTFDSMRPIFRWIEWFDERRARRGISYGDQAQFFRRGEIERCGGFPAFPIMEDLALAHRLLQLGRPIYTNAPVTVSTRRYERQGVLWTALQNWNCRIAFMRKGESSCRDIYQTYYAEHGDASS